MEHVVKIEGVCKKHGSKQNLKDISFTARSGRITAFWVQMVQGKVRP